MATQNPGPAPAPWEIWKLDANFLATLDQWTRENPENSLDRVLGRVCLLIDQGREFFEVIPDGAFPARGLVKALAHLVKLGQTMSTAKLEVRRFAEEVIHWVSQVSSTFASAQTNWMGAQFTQTTWRNLADMRDLIDEICKWATSRLLDQRWSLAGIKNKLVVNKEIAEFKDRIAEARAIFNERSLVCQAWGIDAILQAIWRILNGQGRIEATVHKIRATQAKDFKLVNERLDADKEEEQQRRKAEERRRYVAEMLSKHAVTNTSYDEQGKSPCDKNTRVDILKEIMEWVQDTSRGSQNFLWLTGDPGSGKSAVTASVARDCKDKGFLWAQFFINRNNANTTNPNAYFPSIARQLAARSDGVELEIHDRLKAKPSVMDAISSEQATALLIHAVRVASTRDPKKPVVIIIDGLDETDRSHLKTTADIFSRLFDALSNCSNAKIFISSRTEDDIRTPFARTMNNQYVKHLHLDTAAESSIEDVSTFLKGKIRKIVFDNDLDWGMWPGDERFDKLARNASGLFIWAVTTTKFLQEQIDLWGTECLNDILDKLNSDGMNDINTLYGLILSFTYKGQADEWAFKSFCRIIGAIVALHEPLCLDDISQLLALRRTPFSLPVDVIKFVKRLRTVLVAGADAIDGQTVPRLHKSFFEFITNHDRVDSRFYVDSDASHRELGLQCLHRLALAHSATATIRMPTLFLYAFKFWSQHLSQGFGTASGVAIADNSLTTEEFQLILQHSSNRHNAAPMFVTFSQHRSHIQASLSGRTRTWTTFSGIDQASTFIPASSSPNSNHTLSNGPYVLSRVQFLQGGRSVGWGCSDQHIYLWDMESENTIRKPLGAHLEGKPISAVAFSRDGSRFATGSQDGSICFWNSNTAKIVGDKSFKLHDHLVTCAGFSPTGDWLVSGYRDGIIQFWDLRQVSKPLGLEPLHSGHTKEVSAVTFAPDGAHVLSCSVDNTICLWDTQKSPAIHQLKHLLFEGHTMAVLTIAFLPDGKLAVSGSADKTIRFWDVRSGNQVGSALEGHTDHVTSLDVSPDGTRVVSGSHDKSIRVWDVETRQLIGLPLADTDWVRSVAFSPDGLHICSCSGDQTIRMWTAINPDTLDDEFETEYTTFSPNGNQAISVCHDGSVRLWDSKGAQNSGLLVDALARAQGVRFASFSPDGSQVAVLTSGSVLLYNANTGDLLASSPIDSSPTIHSLYFTRDSRLVIEIDSGTTVFLKRKNKALLKLPVPPGLRTYLPEAPQQFFDVKENQYLDNEMAAGNMRWFPSNNPDSGLWAFIDNQILRAHGTDGSMMILPVERPREYFGSKGALSGRAGAGSVASKVWGDLLEDMVLD